MARLIAIAAFAALSSITTAWGQDISSSWPEQGQPPEKARDPLPPSEWMSSPRANMMVIDVGGASGFNVANRNMAAEPSIAVNPTNPQQVVILSFAGSLWSTGGAAPLWYSTNGGLAWNQFLSIPEPRTFPTDNCPCDQAPDFGQNGILYITFLRVGGGNLIYTGQSTNPASPAAWSWNPAGLLPSLPTSSFGAGAVDQPWLWTGRDPVNANQTNVYVGYDDFTSTPPNPPGNPLVRVAASLGASPPNFPATRDLPANLNLTPLAANPGHRIVVSSTGNVFSIHGKSTNLGGGVKLVTYIVNRSTNAGATWTIPGGAAPGGGLVVATARSLQGAGYKMGDPTGGGNGNNALFGNITAIAVDPNTQVVYTCYGLLDQNNNRNWLVVRRLIPAPGGGYTIGPAFVASMLNRENALPCLAVLNSGEVGLLYTRYNSANDTYDVRLVQSADAFATRTNTLVKSFANFVAPSSFAPSGNLGDKQRILGDYQQIKANGNTYYGTFAARGAGGLNAQSVMPYFVRADGDAPTANQACCLPDGTCQSLPPASCASLNGVAQGNGTTCAGANCGAAGACCQAGGVCAVLTRANCLAAPGTFQGTGSACAAAEACYLPNGTCVMLAPICCNGQGGVPQGVGTTCAANEQCCLPNGTCVNSDPGSCAIAGGTAGGAGSACAANEQCTLPDGSCINTDPACCAAAGGLAGGVGSMCAANRRCCLPDGTCINTDPLACGLIPGAAAGGAGSACGAVQGCCMPTNACLNLDPACCMNAGGTPQGAGNLCTATRRCCLPAPNNVCVDLDPLCCAALMPAGTAGAAGTSCGPRVACCTAGGANCINTAAACCTAPGSTVNASGLQCQGDLNGNGSDDSCDCLCLGDTDGSGAITVADINSLTNALLGIAVNACADVNFDGVLNGKDIDRFKVLIVAGTPCGP